MFAVLKFTLPPRVFVLRFGRKMDAEENILRNKPKNTIGETGSIFYRIFLSLCLTAFSLNASYLGGLFNLSPCWLIGILVVFFYRDHRRLVNKFNQQLAIAVFMRDEQQLIDVNVTQPPSWISFLEIERCESLNKILSCIWPNMSKYAEITLKNAIEPNINEAISAYKSNPNFKFRTTSLGSTIPRICGLKVSKNHSRLFENIILDVRFFYVGDANIYFSLMSLGGGVQNVEISGWLRVVFRILVQPHPLLGGIEIFFLGKPKVDFDFAGAMDILKVPGISGMLHKTIEGLLSLPNKFTIQTNDITNSGHWKCPDPDSLIRIHVIGAKDLTDNGSSFFGRGTSDTYVIVTFGTQTVFSKSCENSLNPEWNFWANFMVDYTFIDESFFIYVNGKSGDESLGKVVIELKLAKEKKYICSWVQLEDTSSGMIHLEIFYHNLTYDILNVVHELKLSYLLVVFINSAFHLVNPITNNIPKTAVYLEISEDIQVSKPVVSTNPVFEEAFLFVINNDPRNCRLTLKLVDLNSKTDLGNAMVPLKPVFEANFMEVIDQTYPLLGPPKKSSLCLSMRIRATKQ